MTDVLYKSDAGTVFEATLHSKTGRTASITIKGDPFPVTVNRSQIKEGRAMPTATATKASGARELRQQAQALGIENYREMGKAELAAAVEAAESARNGTAPRRRKTQTAKAAPAKATPQKATTRKAAPAKAAPQKSTKAKAPAKTAPQKAVAKKGPTKGTATKARAADTEARRQKAAEAKRKGKSVKDVPILHRAGRMSAEEQDRIRAAGPNPFRHGSNIWHITEALLKGGKRQTLINRLKTKIEFSEQVTSKDGFDLEEEIDKRLRVFGYTLRNEHGFGYVMVGRGREAWIQVFPEDADIPEKFEGKVEYDKTDGKYDRRATRA